MNKFCCNCGVKNEMASKFCLNCGEQLEDNIESKEVLLPKDLPDENIRVGIIFTNIMVLSQKLNVDKKQISTLLEQYASALKSTLVHYTIIDSSNYSYLNPEVKDKYRHVSLTSNDGYLEHSHLLADYYKFGIDKKEESPSYLFIIGGDSIIPMPFISRDDMGVSDVDSDLPYSYLLSEKTYCISENLDELFAYTPFFQVGRLPLGDESKFDDLKNYLFRAASVSSCGVQITKAFGQSDIHWKEVSHMVAEKVVDMLPRINEGEIDNYCYRGIMTTPAVVSGREDIDRCVALSNILDPSSNLLYFNLHGNDAPKNGDYFGEIPNASRNYLSAVAPEHIASLCENNIIVTEACFGGKFMIRDTSSNRTYSLEREYSISLSAMCNKTLVFLGSSRVAFGVPRAVGLEDTPNGCCADIICKTFIDSICENYCSGDALFLARRAILTDKFRQKTDPGCNIASIFEFNLFGDPTIFAYKHNKSSMKLATNTPKMVTTQGAIPPLWSNDKAMKYKNTEIYSAEKRSVLQQIRALVDKNIEEIKNSINEYLYSNFGVEPRDLKKVTKIEYSSKDPYYCFTYKKESGEFNETVVVTSNSLGKIESIITSK